MVQQMLCGVQKVTLGYHRYTMSWFCSQLFGHVPELTGPLTPCSMDERMAAMFPLWWAVLFGSKRITQCLEKLAQISLHNFGHVRNF